METYTSAVLKRKRIAVSGFYFSMGVVFASWASRIPDVKQLLALSDGQLGTILFAIPMGQLAMMAFSGILVSKLGSKLTLVFATLMYATVLMGIGLADTFAHVFATLFLFGAMANMLNIATV